MIILPGGVLSFVHGWDLHWEGGGFGLVWCFLKRPYIALLLEKQLCFMQANCKTQTRTFILCQKDNQSQSFSSSYNYSFYIK